MYSIFILHQTTTSCVTVSSTSDCILSLFYIKPQLIGVERYDKQNCILSLFYIKPQLVWYNYKRSYIVFYLYSTSNHNSCYYHHDTLHIVFYLYSTSNHNLQLIDFPPMWLYSIFILHQTTTCLVRHLLSFDCILSLFYIKPQLNTIFTGKGLDCILSLFYIKPQLLIFFRRFYFIVFYLYSTSNHN